MHIAILCTQNHMNNRYLIKSISIKAKTMSHLKLMSPMKTGWLLLTNEQTEPIDRTTERPSVRANDNEWKCIAYGIHVHTHSTLPHYIAHENNGWTINCNGFVGHYCQLYSSVPLHVHWPSRFVSFTRFICRFICRWLSVSLVVVFPIESNI